jgi:hypothetical protein
MINQLLETNHLTNLPTFYDKFVYQHLGSLKEYEKDKLKRKMKLQRAFKKLNTLVSLKSLSSLSSLLKSKKTVEITSGRILVTEIIENLYQNVWSRIKSKE